MDPVDGTVADFGEQWTHYGDSFGYYASLDLLRDALGPLLSLDEIRGARVADVGSGSGRIVRMLCEAGAAHVLALEPSEGVHALRANTRELGDRVEVMHARGDALPPDLGLDLVFSIGVLQFVPDPQPIVRAAHRALRPGGRCVVWVYGREGLWPYLLVVRPLRVVTTRLPHAALALLCHVLNGALDVYILACRWLPLPLRDYMVHIVARLSRSARRLTIYDQLNPRYAKYYREEEARALLEDVGFEDVRLHHRRGYSWTVLGRKPD